MALICAFILMTFGISVICWIDDKRPIWNMFYMHEKCKFLILKFSKVMQQHQGSTNLENLELSGNFVNREKSGKSEGIWDMVGEFFMTCHMVCDLLINEFIFACNV